MIDELDENIHSLVMHDIVSLFNDKDINKNNAQIVFTAHNLDCLDNTIFRRDQIWFVEKNEDGESRMYSLAEIKGVRADLDYKKAYLAGRFGAIPYQ
jgi:AAA15 family ATPase/GTPase